MPFSFSELQLPSIPNKLEGEAFERFKRSLSAVMFTQRYDVFEAQASREGPWKPLSEIQAERRMQKLERVPEARLKALEAKGFSRVKMLQDTGTLRKSFSIRTGETPPDTVELGEDYVRIFTNVEYAAIQNFGGTIYPKKGQFLVFTAADGRKVFAKKVAIPARPFDEFTDEQEDQLAEFTERYLNGEL